MEQKRTLWIIAAAGVFLLVVVGAALILYSPSLHRSQSQIAFNPNDGWVTPAPTTQVERAEIPANPFERPEATPPEMQGRPDFSGDLPGTVDGIPQTQYQTSTNLPGNPYQGGSQTIQSENVTVISDNATVVGTGTTTIDLNTLKSASSAVSAQNSATAAQIAQTQTSQAVQESQKVYNYENTSSVSAAKSSASTKASTSSKSSAKASTAKASTKSTTKASTAKTSAKASTTKVADKFWVQVASYANKKSADDAREVLESSKLPCEVLTYTDSKGKLFYRVRVGSYTTESEAKYWMTRIQAIDQFAKSGCYVVNSSAKAVK